jgi:carbon monoxide dehydrogenase subunit G
MATLHKEILIAAPCAEIWAAARDVGALHTRLVPGFVVDTKLCDDAGGAVRIVTFANGMTLREPILSIDDERRRLAWGAEGGVATHYNAVLQLEPEGAGTRVRWTSDFLPHALAPTLSDMQDAGLAAMRRAFEARTTR